MLAAVKLKGTLMYHILYIEEDTFMFNAYNNLFISNYNTKLHIQKLILSHIIMTFTHKHII